MRNITIVSSDTQSKVTFETEATTVAELLAELDARSINYEGKALFEGISHTPINLAVPEGVLPHDNQWKGTVTNDLVIMVTSGKKVASGASAYDRKVLYNSVKQLGLQDVIKERYGVNYTNVASGLLDQIIREHCDAPENPAQPATEEPCSECCPLEQMFLVFLAAAMREGLIDPHNVVSVLVEEGYMKPVGGEEEQKAPFSDDDIKEMFHNLK